ncbi:DUF6452 family protein [Bizionia arctica]|uniref:Uncharacterized protein n=1 Tax=Bizionia arctica TaxID=1495645 RepID=A0A917GL87_9FLAO|nr:DUF6452 family protein [Bizionia arctica]GGG50382.1 hypothetical protein GCM10010976_21960 [Bizionia arctica]
MKKIIALLLLCFAVTNCEKDDICSESTETTPNMHVAFYSITIPSDDIPKSVTKLRITGVGNSEVLSINDGATIYNGASDVTEAYLPLKTTENNTQYVLHKNYSVDEDDVVLGNPDTISIDYIRKEVFVSRACGYKIIYENVVLTVLDDGDNWIQLALAANDNQTVENEEEIQYKIYH